MKPHWNNNELLKTKQLFSCIDILSSVVTAIDPIIFTECDSHFFLLLMVIISGDQEGATPLRRWQNSPKKKNVNQISLI